MSEVQPVVASPEVTDSRGDVPVVKETSPAPSVGASSPNQPTDSPASAANTPGETNASPGAETSPGVNASPNANTGTPNSTASETPAAQSDGPEIVKGQYSLEELVAAKRGGEIEITMKEKYLTDDVFRELFGMEPAEFEQLPKWKQNRMKKDHGLF